MPMFICRTVAGPFAELIGVVGRPSVALAVEVLRGFGRRSLVGPEAAAVVYGYLQRESADLEPLRKSATIHRQSFLQS